MTKVLSKGEGPEAAVDVISAMSNGVQRALEDLLQLPPTRDAGALETLGYRIALYPVAMLHAFLPAAQRVLAEILATGSTESSAHEMYDLADMNKLLGADALLASGKHYDTDSSH